MVAVKLILFSLIILFTLGSGISQDYLVGDKSAGVTSSLGSAFEMIVPLVQSIFQLIANNPELAGRVIIFILSLGIGYVVGLKVKGNNEQMAKLFFILSILIGAVTAAILTPASAAFVFLMCVSILFILAPLILIFMLLFARKVFISSVTGEEGGWTVKENVENHSKIIVGIVDISFALVFFTIEQTYEFIRMELYDSLLGVGAFNQLALGTYNLPKAMGLLGTYQAIITLTASLLFFYGGWLLFTSLFAGPLGTIFSYSTKPGVARWGNQLDNVVRRTVGDSPRKSLAEINSEQLLENIHKTSAELARTPGIDPSLSPEKRKKIYEQRKDITEKLEKIEKKLHSGEVNDAQLFDIVDAYLEGINALLATGEK